MVLYDKRLAHSTLRRGVADLKQLRDLLLGENTKIV
jgi:hypothetical protein